MKGKIFTIILFIFFSISMLGQTNFTISGYVQDNESGENLIGVSIYDRNTFKGTATNQYGFYSLTLVKGKYDITYSFVGLESVTKNISLNKDTRINISLENNSILTEEVIVKGEKLDKNIQALI